MHVLYSITCTYIYICFMYMYIYIYSYIYMVIHISMYLCIYIYRSYTYVPPILCHIESESEGGRAPNWGATPWTEEALSSSAVELFACSSHEASSLRVLVFRRRGMPPCLSKSSSKYWVTPWSCCLSQINAVEGVGNPETRLGCQPTLLNSHC